MIFIVFIVLISLLVAHEFGHFILAKRFGVKVEEFGIGYPPRIFGKKIGETIYSLNLLPFGAFVNFPDENNPKEERKYSMVPTGKRMLIALGGVISFWIIAAIILSIVYTLGTRVAVADEENNNLIDPRVLIVAINRNSPADLAGLKPGDAIIGLEVNGEKVNVIRSKDIQEFTSVHSEQKVLLAIERGKDKFNVLLVPRKFPPAGEGSLGVSLIKTAVKNYPWYSSVGKGILTTVNLTIEIIKGYCQALVNVFRGLPSGVEPVGPVGIFQMVNQASRLGFSYFLQFVGMICIYLAIFNAMPIPVADGGKMVFLIIETLRKKPLNRTLEQKIDTVFFVLLIALMVLVTIKDVSKLF